jgi:hypothetical protein
VATTAKPAAAPGTEILGGRTSARTAAGSFCGAVQIPWQRENNIQRHLHRGIYSALGG